MYSSPRWGRGGPPRGSHPMSGGRGRRHHGRGPGFDPWAFGPGHRGGGPGGPGRGRRARRGDVRAAILLLLEEEPRNGYQLMEEIELRSDGAWRPSPGSVYPALAQLEDEGLVRTEEAEGRRSFELTDAGKAHVEEHRGRLGAPWEKASRGVPEALTELRTLVEQVGLATMQVAQSASDEQLAEAKKVLGDARRALYRILAEAD